MRYRRQWIGVVAILGGVLCAVSNGICETTYSLPVATNLDLNRVVIEFDSAHELREAFRAQTAATFARFGVVLPPAAFSAEGKDFTLKFTEKQISLEPHCSGKVYYIARRELVEPVYIQRNGKLIVLNHWDTARTYDMSNPRSRAELLESLDAQLGQFLVFYMAGNPQAPSSKGLDTPMVSSDMASEGSKPNAAETIEGQPSNGKAIKTVLFWEEWNSLDRLDLDQLYWLQQDEALFPHYKLVAERFLRDGITLRDTWPDKMRKSSVPSQLIFTIKSIALGEECPGYVVYTVGVALREPVLIKRNSLEHLADTWGTFRVQVRPAVTPEEMEQDLLRLADRVLLELKAAEITLRGKKDE